MVLGNRKMLVGGNAHVYLHKDWLTEIFGHSAFRNCLKCFVPSKSERIDMMHPTKAFLCHLFIVNSLITRWGDGLISYNMFLFSWSLQLFDNSKLVLFCSSVGKPEQLLSMSGILGK